MSRPEEASRTATGAPGGEGPIRVVVAGGGVAALEALLALRKLAAGRVETLLLAPGSDFVYQPLAVAEPFGAAEPHRVPLSRIAADTGATLISDRMEGVEPERRVVLTGRGDPVPFDALLIAIGARRLSDVLGALTYRGGIDNAALEGVLRDAEGGRVRRLAFAVPASVRWPLALYDLVLLTAARLRERGSETRISLVTHETAPLGLFGRRASEAVRSLLAEAAVDLRTSTTPVRVERGALTLTTGTRIPADRVIALPRLQVPRLAGVPQGPLGFIGTDRHMRVEGLSRVYAAGDATWFPIKQGGIAAQQADAAASLIASIAGAEVKPEPFRPVLRGAILTGGHPLFLRSPIGDRNGMSASSREPLWWPPSKLAGKYLASYLRDSGAEAEIGGALEDLQQPLEPDPVDESDYRQSVELALRAADLDASEQDYRGALRWLQVVEDLEIALPAEYADRRERWRRAAGEQAGEAATPILPRES